MITTNNNDAAVASALYARISSTWQRRATVKRNDLDLEAMFDDEMPDYPVGLVPFRDHPKFADAPDEVKRRVLSCAWLAYNKNTVSAEEMVANPAFALILHDRFPGTDDDALKQGIAQAIVDENYHTLMHLNASAITRRKRNITGLEAQLPPSLTYRKMRECQEETADEFEKDLLVLTFAVISEISINAYLSLLSSDKTIQPINRITAELHNRDEFSHALLTAEVAKAIYAHLTPPMRSSFERALPRGLRAFVAGSFDTWRVVLNFVGFKPAEVDEIIHDCEKQSGNKALVRDYSGLKNLAEELGITGRLDFEFA